MQRFKNLTIWQKSHALALQIYRVTETFPEREQYALTAQLRRTAVSIPSNIVEGTARGSDREAARFLRIARGSAAEMHCQLLLAQDLGFVSEADCERLTEAAEEIRKLLTGFIKRLSPSTG
ncbi:MAG TPA: four helix bundle protein [Gemmatimonadales bacterium]|nr:four helix bundle protein [Gemmatimonadales bacterium]